MRGNFFNLRLLSICLFGYRLFCGDGCILSNSAANPTDSRLKRLRYVGVLPYFFNGVFGAQVSFGGTSLIIIVSVVLETVKQVESQMLVRNYKGFLND